MVKCKINKGFTLIELLVVVGIISILTTVVLASLNNSREKGRVAKVQSSMKNFSSEASILIVGSNTNVGYWYNLCPTTTGSATGSMLTNTNLMNILNDARASGGGNAYCIFGSNSKWVVAVDLPNKTTVWCTDHTGVSKKLPGGWDYGTYGDAINVSEYTCK